MSLVRTRWAAIGAAVAVTLGAGGIGLVSATVDSGERPVLIPIDPCRVTDTRPGDDNVGPKATPLGPGEIHTISAHGDNGDCTGIPTDAVALSLNVTALDATQLTYLTIWATGDEQPFSSSLNPSPGQPPTPNAVTTGLSTKGQFDIFNESGNVNVIVDITGYYADHNHDDLYYTKRESDNRFVSALGPRYYEPHMLSIVPEQQSAWRLQLGWDHSPTPGDNECVYAQLDAASGTTISTIVVNYVAQATVTASAVVVGMRTSTGPAEPAARLLYHLTKQDAALEATGAVEAYTFKHDPDDVPLGLSRSPVGDDSYDTMVVFCTEDAFSLSSIRVNYG